MQSPNEPQDGFEYSYEEVGGFYNHDPSPLNWVLFKGMQIVALRLREDYNPAIGDSWLMVWVGADSPTKEWGNTLANDTVRVPVFYKRINADKYTYLGTYEVIADDTSEEACAAAAKVVKHDRGISRIVMLQKA